MEREFSVVYGGFGSVSALIAGAGVIWGVDRINPYANRTAVVLAGLAVTIVGLIANRTDLIWGTKRDPRTGALQKERHHFFWVSVEWWGLAVMMLGFFA